MSNAALNNFQVFCLNYVIYALQLYRENLTFFPFWSLKLINLNLRTIKIT